MPDDDSLRKEGLTLAYNWRIQSIYHGREGTPAGDQATGHMTSSVEKQRDEGSYLPAFCFLFTYSAQDSSPEDYII